MPNIKILTGAPRAANVDLSLAVALSEWLPAFDRFLGRKALLPQTKVTSTLPSSNSWPEWRVVPIWMPKPKLRARPSIEEHSVEESRSESNPDHQQAYQGISPLPANSLTEINIDRTDEFLEESFAIYNSARRPLNTRQGVEDDENTSFISRTTADFSFMSSASYESTNSQALLPKTVRINLPSEIENLKDLPKPEYLVRISPQTITVNLAVGVISVAPPRTVQLRRYDSTMEIVEVLVGDETRTGFSIKFWLPPHKPHTAVDATRETLLNLRPRDVVLFRNVALHVWQQSVYGQSLSKRISHNETKVELLGRDGEVDVETTGDDLSPQVAKVKRVSGWVVAFLGMSKASRRKKALEEPAVDVKGRHSRFDDIELPPETQ